LPVDGRADLFALGLLMWEMLAGRPPFVGDSPRILLEKICTHPTPHLPDHARQGLPPAVEALIFRLLEKDPRARPASANEVIALLEPWTKSVMTQAPPPVQPAFRPSAPQQPRLDTIDIVEGARKGSLERRVEQKADAIVEGLTRFARATSTRIVRVLVGLLALPAAALVFVGVPLVLVGMAFVLLEQDGVDFDDTSSLLSPAVALAVALVVVVVFVRTCWSHHRPPLQHGIWKPWWVLGALLNGGWAAMVAFELVPGNELNAEIHGFFLTIPFVWLTITMSWVTGRITSRLFRRLER
jgi:hypothetical protein